MSKIHWNKQFWCVALPHFFGAGYTQGYLAYVNGEQFVLKLPEKALKFLDKESAQNYIKCHNPHTAAKAVECTIRGPVE